MSDVRTYRGLSAQERLTDRKERLLAAALERFGGQGYSATTIEMLCTDAKVSTRGFYECFDGRESLLRVLYDRILGESGQRVRQALDMADGTVAGLVRAGLTAYIGYMTADERRARIAHVEVRRAGEPLHTARRAAVHDFAEVIAGLADENTTLTGLDVRRLSVGLVGAVQELLIDWVHSTPRPSTEEVVATAEYLFLAAFPQPRFPQPPTAAAPGGPL
ncbi:MAG TPA: helix-turn-helix domain-containing protein [Streptosporangiaceae bacterium]|jgi:AcrR family transcriptional regulator|nr:helix-turn-helix domain-containing protein [Streptosporangiaceae bacterium]